MKTLHYSLNLLTQHQLAKDAVINENFAILDKIINRSVKGEARSEPAGAEQGDIYVLMNATEALYENYLIIKDSNSENTWLKVNPPEGMVIWFQHHNAFYCYTEKKWRKIPA